MKTLKRLASAALAIQSASNASGVAHTLLDGLTLWRELGGDWNGKQCAALRLISFHLAFLMGGGDGGAYPGDYHSDYDICHAFEAAEKEGK